MDRPRPPTTSVDAPRLRVLASGSSGNCSVLRTGRTTILIDAGISPKRTRLGLAECGLDLEDVDALLLTHLDADHYDQGWNRALPERVPVFVHATHARAAASRGIQRDRRRTFDGVLDLSDELSAAATLTNHDDLGTAAFRFRCEGGGDLGFATDLGRATDGLVDLLRGVDVLAVESNYCPKMQVASDRPWFLKQRVMGGRGHLSNEDCVSLVADVGPRSHVVLLHLSRQCNDPTLVARLHARQHYRLTISSQTRPTPWITIEAGAGAPARVPRPVVTGSLFDHLETRREKSA